MITNQETIINDCRTVQYTKTFGKIYMLFFCNDRRIHHACFYRSKWGARKSIRLIYCFLKWEKGLCQACFYRNRCVTILFFRTTQELYHTSLYRNR